MSNKEELPSEVTIIPQDHNRITILHHDKKVVLEPGESAIINGREVTNQGKEGNGQATEKGDQGPNQGQEEE